MRLLEGHLWRLCLRSALLAILMFCGGCQTATKSLFTASGPGWHVQEGQALWRPGRGYPELAGDIVVATDERGRCLAQFAKTPLTLVSVQTTPTRWLVQFPPAGIGFSGARQPPAGMGKAPLRSPKEPASKDAAKRPPTRFMWLYLYAALSGKELPPPFHFVRKPDGGWKLENTRSGETLEGFLAP